MTIRFPATTKYILNLMLPFVLLFQWTMPAMGKKKEILINFSDITFKKCNNPEHSHPPLSQRETPEDQEKLVNSDLNSFFVVNSFQKYFDISVKIIIEKPENTWKKLFKYLPPVRGPPYLEV